MEYGPAKYECSGCKSRSDRRRSRMDRKLSHANVGRIRRLIMIRGTHRWNAWVRDVTARLG
jgi:hypothetical protein